MSATIMNLPRSSNSIGSSVPPQSPQKSANDGDPPIMKYAQEGDVDGLHQVIEKHKDQFQQFRVSNNRKTPLHIAAAWGETEFVLESMNLLPWLNEKLDEDGRTALHVAILKGHERTAMEILKENPVLMRRRDKEGRNALHLAVAHKNKMPNLLKTLLEKDPGLIAQVNYEKQTALDIALEKGKYEKFSSLLSGMKDRAQLQHLLEMQDSKGNTVLHIAAVKATPEATMKKLLTIMKNLDLINEEQETALDLAVDQNMKFLLERAGAQRGHQVERVSWNSSKTSADKILSFLLSGPKSSLPVSFLVLLIAVAFVFCQNPLGAILKNAAPPIPTPIPAPGPYSRKELGGHIHGNMGLPDVTVVISLVFFILMAIISILTLIWRSGWLSLAAPLFAVLFYSEMLGNPAWLIPFSIALLGTLCVLVVFEAGVHLYEDHIGYLWWRRRAMNWVLNMLPPLKKAIRLSQEEERMRNL